MWNCWYGRRVWGETGVREVKERNDKADCSTHQSLVIHACVWRSMWNPLSAFIASQPGRHFGSERTGQNEGLERGEACQKEHVFMKWRHCLPVTHACAHTQRCVTVTQRWLEQTGVEVLVRWGLLEEVCVHAAGKLLGHDKGWTHTLQGSCSCIGHASVIVTLESMQGVKLWHMHENFI